ncbi:MAG TPA: hypothetical protein VKZ46_02925, partial [Pedomonas sp.]|nr:hypothetical protein [Pedomonas sp.]
MAAADLPALADPPQPAVLQGGGFSIAPISTTGGPFCLTADSSAMSLTNDNSRSAARQTSIAPETSSRADALPAVRPRVAAIIEISKIVGFVVGIGFE